MFHAERLFKVLHEKHGPLLFGLALQARVERKQPQRIKNWWGFSGSTYLRRLYVCYICENKILDSECAQFRPTKHAVMNLYYHAVEHVKSASNEELFKSMISKGHKDLREHYYPGFPVRRFVEGGRNARAPQKWCKVFKAKSL